LCGRYLSIKECTLYPDVLVCIHCCLSCVERSSCPKPAWRVELEKPVASKGVSLEERRRVFEDLLSKLEGGKKS